MGHQRSLTKLQDRFIPHMPAQVDCFLFPLSLVEKLDFLTPKERGVMFPRQDLGPLVHPVPRLFRVPPSWKFWQKVGSGRKGMVATLTRSACSQLGTEGPRPPAAGWCFSGLISDFFLSETNQEGVWKAVSLTGHSGCQCLSPGHCFFRG